MTLVVLTVRPRADVHPVAARFDRSGWTLRFGASTAVVPRLAEADAVARHLVAAALGVSPASVCARIVPEPTLPAGAAGLVDEGLGRAPWWRGKGARM